MIVMASKGHLERQHSSSKQTHRKPLAPHILFDANTTADAKELGDERDLVGGLHLDTEFTCVNDRHTFRASTYSYATSY